MIDNKEIAAKSNPKTFTREFTDSFTKIKQTWYYDLEKFGNGAYKIETTYPDGMETYNEKQKGSHKIDGKPNKPVNSAELKNGDCEDDSLPLTQRRYWSSLTNKYVGYTRSKVLGLIK